MSERATRPLNNEAVKAADDELYAKHADEPRPNALYDEDGNRKPLSANDPDQAGLRKEWMNSYKANGGETEPADLSGSQAGQAVSPCDQKPQVDPLIIGDAIEIDVSEVPDVVQEPVEEAEEPEADAVEEESEAPPEQPLEIAVTQRLKGGSGEAETDAGDLAGGDEAA